jgi:hypothetical protein
MPIRDPGLYLRLRVEGPLVTVEAAAVIPRWSRTRLRAPLLTPETYQRIAAPGAETVAALLDKRGGVLASFGFSETPKAFFDRKGGEQRGRLRGYVGDASLRLREISLPFPGHAEFLYFYRSQCIVTLDSDVPRLDQRYVALYSVAKRGKRSLPAPPLPVPAPFPVTPAPLPWLPERDKRQSR